MAFEGAMLWTWNDIFEFLLSVIFYYINQIVSCYNVKAISKVVKYITVRTNHNDISICYIVNLVRLLPHEKLFF